MTAHIYLGSNKVDDIHIVHTDLDKIPREKDLVGITVEDQYVSGKVDFIEWLIDKEEVNIFLK